MIIIGGANGSGKSTLARQLLAGSGARFLNADDIAKEMDPDDTQGGRLTAGRVYFKRMQEAFENETHIAIESTLSGRVLLAQLRNAKTQGWYIKLNYLFVSEPETCIFRVNERVRKGGHEVPAEDIVRRFHRSLKKFWMQYRPISDEWHLFANNESSLYEIAAGSNDIDIYNQCMFDQFITLVEGNTP